MKSDSNKPMSIEKSEGTVFDDEYTIKALSQTKHRK